MQRPVIFILAVLFSISSHGQIVPSSCTAPDSIIAKYNEDAHRLALKKINRRHLVYQDSAIIPQVHIDTVLRALIAVYNATALPARDTVCVIKQVHEFGAPFLREVSIYADSSLGWMHQLKLGQIPTGTTAVDTLLINYHFDISSYSVLSVYPGNHKVILHQDTLYNMHALSLKFLALPGVMTASEGGIISNDQSIEDSIYNDHVELVYRSGWGDCPAGCIYNRYWKFKVYYDCSVEFVGSYGDILVPQSVTATDDNKIRLSPNPFTSFITIQGQPGAFDYTMLDIFGRTVAKGESKDSVITGLNNLADGMYLLTIKTNKGIQTFKVCKQ